MVDRYDTALIKRRATQALAPQSGVEQSQGNPYAILPGVTRKLEVPGDPGINIRGWVSPYKLTFYGIQVPEQGVNPSVVALAGNFRRCYLIIQNKGPGNLFVNFGVEADTDGLNCLQLVATQVYEQIGGGGVFPDRDSPLASSFVARDSVYVLTDAPLTTCVIGEGVWTSTGPNMR